MKNTMSRTVRSISENILQEAKSMKTDSCAVFRKSTSMTSPVGRLSPQNHDTTKIAVVRQSFISVCVDASATGREINMKKSIATALLFALLAAVILPCAAWSSAPNTVAMDRFTDIPKKAWYYDDVEWAVRSGIMKNNGDPTKFEPQTTLNRAMFTQICYNFLSKGLGRNVAYDAIAPFTDVKQSSWFCDAVSFAYENGIVSGMGGGRFAPMENITRQQMAVLYRSLIENYFGIELPVDLSILDQFVDRDSIAPWAKEAVAAVVGAELLYGKSGGKFDPAGASTRAEAAALIQRFYRYYGRTYQCFLGDVDLVPTMLEDFDGAGKDGWNHNFWLPVEDSDAPFLPAKDASVTVYNPALGRDVDINYSSERMYTEDGALYMTAYYPAEYNTDDNGICGLIYGHDLPTQFSQAFGYYEIRFKPAQARAICSAWWLTTNGGAQPYPSWGGPGVDYNNPPTSDPYENFVEMDIFETTRSPQGIGAKTDKLTTTLHWNHWKPGGDQGRFAHQYALVERESEGVKTNAGAYLPDWSLFDGAYHTIGFLWDKDGYAVYYDGNYMGNFERAVLSDMEAVLRLNLYYWNTTNEKPYNGDCYREDFDEEGKSTFVIDYVHVYQFREYLDEYAPNYHGNPTPAYYAQAIGE